MRDVSYAHPEFGYFSPSPRLRRELRIAIFAGLFGTVLGGVAIIALIARDARTSTPSVVQAVTTDGTSVVPASASDATAPAKEGSSAPEPRAWKVRGSPRPGLDLARVPLGHPAPAQNAAEPSLKANATPAAVAGDVTTQPPTPAAPPTAATSAPATAAAPTPVTAAKATAVAAAPLPAEAAAPDTVQAAPAPAPKAHKVASGQNRRRSEPAERTAGLPFGFPYRGGRAEHASARDPFSLRSVFWDWR
ncbi:MAG: hypothetical protein ACJ8F3_14200 [Xanthobacteraceae bacterium]